MTALAPDRAFCLTQGGIRTRADLLTAAARLRGALSGHDAVCNLIRGRYDFAALLLAAMAEAVPTLLPSARADAAIAAALTGCRTPLVAEDLPERGGTPGPELSPLAELPGAVALFTSGSTGTPVRHTKRWHQLAEGASPAAHLIREMGLSPGTCVVAGTTPHQHMYGMEAALFTGIAHGHCLWDGTVFYPADIEILCAHASDAGLEAVVLITSPPHLTYLEDAIVAHPIIRGVISATAPLHPDMAARIEAVSDAQVHEIYGSTESGSFATRRPTKGPLWTPMQGARLIERPDGWHAVTPLLADPVAMSDRFDVREDGCFSLLGRSGDMVRIAGKRQSLGALNAALAAMPGIVDGAVLCETHGAEDRLHVLVVPQDDADARTTREKVRAWLLAHFDPVFVPRRIRLVSHLPRNETGKIPREREAALIASPDPGPSGPDRLRSNAP